MNLHATKFSGRKNSQNKIAESPSTFIDQLKRSKTQSFDWFYQGIYTFVSIEFSS